MQGNFLLGHIHLDALRAGADVMAAAKLAMSDPRGRCYYSVGPFFSTQWVFVVTKPTDWDQIYIHNRNNISRGSLLDKSPGLCFLVNQILWR